MKISKLVATVVAAVAMTGCATVFHGTDQVLTFTTEPDGADIRVDGKLIGQSPVSYKAPKNKVDSVRIDKDGYKPEVFAVDKKFDNITFLSIFWDLSTTDLISGAAYEYQPSSFHFKLRKEDKKWEADFGYLNRNFEDELRSFVLINFYEIRRADRLDLRDALARLVATHFKMGGDKVKAELGSLVSKSKTPVELLRSINENFQNKSLR